MQQVHTRIKTYKVQDTVGTWPWTWWNSCDIMKSRHSRDLTLKV